MSIPMGGPPEGKNAFTNRIENDHSNEKWLHKISQSLGLWWRGFINTWHLHYLSLRHKGTGIQDLRAGKSK